MPVTCIIDTAPGSDDGTLDSLVHFVGNSNGTWTCQETGEIISDAEMERRMSEAGDRKAMEDECDPRT